MERLTYASTLILSRKEYTVVHGIIESFGGRIKDCQYNWDNDDMIMFYEMSKAQGQEFEKALVENWKSQELKK